jgi:hypothetical protein
MNGLMPGFGITVQRAWDGETCYETLAAELKENNGLDDDGENSNEALLMEAAVLQLCECTSQLQKNHGSPNENKSVSGKRLLKSISSIGCTTEFVQHMMKWKGKD